MTGVAKKKKSFLRKNLDLLLVFVIFAPVYCAYNVTQPVSPFEPREEPFAPYERHVHIGWRFPFVTSYFLMAPENYQPDKYTYPVVLMLHGTSRHMYGGKVLAHPLMRKSFPAFVLIPIAPFGFTWALPERLTLRPQALPVAMATLRSVMKNYSINPEQVYVTGYSMGGLGTFGALTRYHGVFAAAAPTDAIWEPGQVETFDDIPVWMFQGEQDTTASAAVARQVAAAMHERGRPVFYTEYPRQGHGAWVRAYEDADFWSWLFQQRRS